MSMLRLQNLSRVLAVAGVLLAGFAATAPATLATTSERNRSEAFFEEARQYLEKGEVKAAIIQLKNALQNDPDNVAARKLLGQTYLAVGNGPAAVKELRAAMRRGADDTGTKVLLARALLLMHKLEDALSLVPDEVGEDVLRPQVLTTRGQALLGLRRFDEAEAAFRKADELRPDDVRAKVGLAQILVNQRKLSDAEQEIDTALSRNPKSLEAMVMKGELRRLQRDYEGAVVYFDKAIALRPGNLVARLGRAAALIDLGRGDRARPDLQAVIQRFPRHPIAGYLNALMLARKKDYVGAQDALQQAGGTLDGHMPALLLSGVVHYALGQLEQSVQKLRRYVDARPKERRGRILLGTALMRMKEAKNAIEVLEPLLDRMPNDARLLSLLGRAHMRIRDFTKGTEYYTRAARAAPDDASIRTELARGDLALGQADDAIEELQRAVELDPDDHRAAVMLAFVKLKQKDYDGAAEAAKALREKIPDSPLPGNLLGAAYLGKGDLAAARSSFEAVLEQKPDFHPARMNLAQIDVREGKVGRAKERYKEVLEVDDKHVGAMMALSDIASRQNERDEALSWLRRAGAANPKSIAPQLRLIEYYGRLREYQKALSTAQALNRNVPGNPKVMETLGRSETAAGEAVSAVTTFKRLATLVPNSARVLGLLAGAQIAARDISAGRETLIRAVALEEGYLPVRIVLVELEAREGRFDEAMRLAVELREKRRDTTVGDMLIGDVLMRQNQFGNAIKAYSAGLKRAPAGQLAIRRFNARRRAGQGDAALVELQQWVDEHGNRGAHHVLASGYIASGRLDEGIRESEKILAREKNNAIVLNNLAWLYQQKKDKRAIEYAERALQQAPRSPPIMDTLGWILFEMGDVDRALKLLSEARKLAPRQGDIRYHLAAALHKDGQMGEARRELESLLEAEISFSKLDEARDLLKQMNGG